MAKKKPVSKIKERIDLLLKRRPHRSFQLTKRRDYKRSLELPGYIAFTVQVYKTIWTHRKTLLLLALFYAILTVLMVGVASQDTYATIKDFLNSSSGGLLVGGWGEVGKAGLLFFTAINGGISQNLTEVQQVYAGIIMLVTWLTSVWLLRNMLAGHKVRLRDGLYSAGSPIVPTFIVALVFFVQLLPFALALIGYGAASSTGLLAAGGVEAMLFWIAAALLATLSMYWITSTFFALVIVTLPGMYPYKAIKAAGDLVVGRRLRILLRLLWMTINALLTWAIVMIPAIMLDSWIKGVWKAITWFPTVPILLLTLSSLTIIWVSSYVYLLYRKVVADDAEPA